LIGDDMKKFSECKNWRGKLCDPFVRHLYEPTEGYMTIYTSHDEDKAISICQQCLNYEKKEHRRVGCAHKK